MAYGKSKDLIKRTQSDKVLKDKAFKIANNPNYDGYQNDFEIDLSNNATNFILTPKCELNDLGKD